jgi:hypothetical protein
MYLSLLLRCSVIAVALAGGLPYAAADDPPTTGRGQLGVAVTNPSAPWQGALIARVVPQSAAARAGLRAQDLIVQADSQSISSASDLTAYVTTHHAGERIAFTVMRWNGGSAPERVQLTATLAGAIAPGNAGAVSSGQTSPAQPAAAPAPAPARAHAAAPPTASARAAAAPPAQGLANVSWTTFTDPYENAFTIEVPRGWKVAGGVVRKIPLWPSLVLRVLAPDRRTLLALGDADAVPYNAPIAARDYVPRFAERAMSGACQGLKISEVKELPDVERLFSSKAVGPYTKWSAAQAAFTCNGDRQADMSGGAIAVLQYMTTLRGGHAQVLAAFVTTRGQEEQADQLLNHVFASLHENPQWSARQSQTAQQLANGAMARWKGEQRQFQQMDDAITNTAHFLGPNGQRYDLDSMPRYQWLAPDGSTVGTDTPTPPSPGAQALQRQPE